MKTSYGPTIERYLDLVGSVIARYDEERLREAEAVKVGEWATPEVLEAGRRLLET